MKAIPLSTFEFILAMLGLCAVFTLDGKEQSFAMETSVDELKLPDTARVERLDFEQKGIENWKIIDGLWATEEMAPAPSGKRVLTVRPQGSAFNVITAPDGPYGDVDISVQFKPISGQQDASAGIVFRFSDGKYYVVRANALEDNFRLYYYDGGRRQLATAKVEPPALGQWHTLRVIALADLIQAYLDGKPLLNHRDSRLQSGQVGLWTKSDSVTAFDDLIVKSNSQQNR